MDSEQLPHGATPPPQAPIEPHQSSLLSEIQGWARDVFFAIGAAIIIVVFFYQPVKVEGTSMLPELVDQERIFVNKFLYRIDQIQRGRHRCLLVPARSNQVIYQACCRSAG